MSLRSCSRSSCSSSARAKCIACDRITCVAHLEDHCCVTPKPSLDYENDSAGEQICESHSNQEVLVGCQVCLNVFCAICLSESFCSGLASSESGNSEPADASARSRVGHQYVDLVKFKTVCTEKINLHITYTKQRCVTTSRDLKLLKSRAESLLETGHSKLQEARRELEKRIQLIREVNEQEIEKFATHLKKVESQRDDQVNQMETQLATLEKILSQKEVVNENPATIRKFLSAFMEPPQTCVTSPSGDQAVAEDSLVIGEEETYHFIKVASSVQSTATRVLDSKQAKKSQRMSQPSCTVDAHPQQFGNTEPQHLGLGQKTPPISTPELDIHGRKIYSREFLLELRKKPLSQQKPEGLESTDLKHLLEKPDLARKLVLETNQRGAPGFPPDIFRSSTLTMRGAASKPFSEFEADKRKVHQMSTNGEFILKPSNGHSNPYHQQHQVMAQSFSANPPQSVNEGNPQTNNTRPPSSGLITLTTTYMQPKQQYSQPVSQYDQARTAAAPVAPQPTKLQRQPSKAIKIIDPDTLTEVDLKKAEAASQQQAARQTPKVRTSSITIADPKTQATVQPPPKQKTQQPEDDAKIKATKSEFAAVVAAAAEAAVQERAAVSPKSTPSDPATAKPAEQATEADDVSELADGFVHNGLYREFRSQLNQITLQNFDTLSAKVMELPVHTEKELNAITKIIFEKAVSEPSFSNVYAKLCHKVAMYFQVPREADEKQTVIFRKLLLVRCQREFEDAEKNELVVTAKKQAIDNAWTQEEKEALTEEYVKFEFNNRKRRLGNIRFIGELFKLGMLVAKIMHSCIVQLLETPNEGSLECLCKLFTTMGQQLDIMDKHYNNRYFNEMEEIINRKNVTSRVQFMLQDVINLRANDWIPLNDGVDNPS